MKYKLLKDIVTPNTVIEAGSEFEGDCEGFLCRRFRYSEVP